MAMIRSLLTAMPWLVLFSVSAACDLSGGEEQDEDSCPVGSRGCPCTSGRGCDGDLTCIDSLCVLDEHEGNCGATSTGSSSAGDGGSSSAGDGGSTPSEDGGSTSSMGGSSGGMTSSSTGVAAETDPHVCTDAQQNDKWSGLRDWCSWALEVDYAPVYREDYGTCDVCVSELQQGSVDLPEVYCANIFDCWDSCVVDEGPDEFAVSDCIEWYCNCGSECSLICP